MAKQTYDYDIIKKLGERVDIARIQENFYLVFSQLKEQDKELFVAPHSGTRAFKIKSEKELTDFFKSSYFKPKSVEFYAISRKEKLSSAPVKTKSKPLTAESPEQSVQSDSVYLEILQKLRKDKD